jgi:hypothetical protein
MKICIELDEEMKKQWNTAKESLEEEFNRQNNTSVFLLIQKYLEGYLKGGESLRNLWRRCFTLGSSLKKILVECNSENYISNDS